MRDRTDDDAGDIELGEKLSERARNADHPSIRQRREWLSALSYEVHVHRESPLDATKPIFTIILTAHDADIRYVEESITSVFDQQYRNTEVILIDNGTTGPVASLLRRAFEDNANAKLLRVPDNLYDPTAGSLDNPITNLWNAGLFCSIGDFVYCLSYDDSLSVDYSERMVALFGGNPKCATAAPSIVSVNAQSEINLETSKELSSGNRRPRYSDGVGLARSYMRGEGAIRFPGGCLAARSEVVLRCGGFDSMNDLSQLFKFAVHGDSGFDPDAKLYWRHHPKQTNKMLKRMGLVFFKLYSTYTDATGLYEIHRAVAGSDFADEFARYMERTSVEVAISSFRDSYRFGMRAGGSALLRVFQECPWRISARALVYAIVDFPLIFYLNYVPARLQRAYRRVRTAIRPGSARAQAG